MISDLNGSLWSRQFLNAANKRTCFASCACAFKFLGALLQTLGAPILEEYLMLQKERLRLRVTIWAYSSSIEHNKN